MPSSRDPSPTACINDSPGAVGSRPPSRPSSANRPPSSARGRQQLQEQVNQAYAAAEQRARDERIAADRKALLLDCVKTRKRAMQEEIDARNGAFAKHRAEFRVVDFVDACHAKRARVAREEAARREQVLGAAYAAVRRAAALLAAMTAEDEHRVMLEHREDRSWLELESSEEGAFYAASMVRDLRLLRVEFVDGAIAIQLPRLEKLLDEHFAALCAGCDAAFDALLAQQIQQGAELLFRCERNAVLDTEDVERKAIATERRADLAAMDATLKRESSTISINDLQRGELEARGTLVAVFLNDRFRRFNTSVFLDGEAATRAVIEADAAGFLSHAAKARSDGLALDAQEQAEEASRKAIVESEAVAAAPLFAGESAARASTRAVSLARLAQRIGTALGARRACASQRWAARKRRADHLATVMQAIVLANRSATVAATRREAFVITTLQRFVSAACSENTVADLLDVRAAAVAELLQRVGRGYVCRVAASYVNDAVHEARDAIHWRRSIAAMKIQWLVRERRARKIASSHRQAAVAEKQRMRHASVIQGFVRAVASQLTAAAQAETHRQHALGLIQRAGRGDEVRRMMRPASAAFLIQRFARRKIGDLKRYELAFCAPAQKIQCMVRATQARGAREKEAARVAAMRKRRVMDGAARLIQQLPKILAARRRFHQLVADAKERRAQELAALRVSAQATLARIGRGGCARGLLRAKHTSRNELIASAQVWLRHLTAQHAVRLAHVRCLLNAAATICLAANGHSCARRAVDARSAKEVAVVESHAASSASAALLGRVGRGFEARVMLHSDGQEAHAAASIVQRGVRTATARATARVLRQAREKRTRAQECEVAAIVLQRWALKRHRRRVASVSAIQRAFRHFGQHRFSVLRETRAMYADIYACKKRSVLRDEQRCRSAITSDENVVFRDTLMKEATAILGHSHAYPMTRVAARANRRILLRTLVLESEEAASAGAAMESEEALGREAIVATEAAVRGHMVTTALTALGRARAHGETAACAQLVHAENVARLRLARRHLMLLRHAIIEPFHAVVGATYASVRASFENVTEPEARAEVAQAFDQWVAIIAGPQAAAIRHQALACEAQHRRRQAEEAAAREADTSAHADNMSLADASLSGRTDSDLAQAMRERLARRAAQGLGAPPIVGRLRPFSKPTGPNAAAGKRDITAQDLRALLTIPTPSQRLLSGHSDRDDLEDRAAIAKAPPALPPLVRGGHGEAEDAYAPVSANASGAAAVTEDSLARPLGLRPGSGTMYPRFLRRLPALLEREAELVSPAVRGSCVTTADGVLSLADVAGEVNDACVVSINTALRSRSPLTLVLDLTECQLSDTAIVAVLEQLMQRSVPLVELRLRNNKAITDAAVLHIAHRVKLLPTLRAVDLGGTPTSTAKRQLLSHLLDESAAERLARDEASIQRRRAVTQVSEQHLPTDQPGLP